MSSVIIKFRGINNDAFFEQNGFNTFESILQLSLKQFSHRKINSPAAKVLPVKTDGRLTHCTVCLSKIMHDSELCLFIFEFGRDFQTATNAWNVGIEIDQILIVPGK